MTKKKYEKPSVEVVVLKQLPTLLQASVNSSVDATMNGTFVEEDI